MGDIVLAGSTSGTTTLTPAAVSGTTTLTLPATTGTLVLAAAPTFTGQATIPTINLTGGQIKFPATQSASADANTLDDYEEGTWTPVAVATSGGLSATYTSGTKYTKIGRLVHVQAQVTFTAVANQGGGALYFSGLPFSALQNSCGTVMYYAVDLPAGTIQLQSYTDGTNLFFMLNYDNATWGALATSSLQATSLYYFDVVYETS